jgi:hypothetical protein
MEVRKYEDRRTETLYRGYARWTFIGAIDEFQLDKGKLSCTVYLHNNPLVSTLENDEKISWQTPFGGAQLSKLDQKAIIQLDLNSEDHESLNVLLPS